MLDVFAAAAGVVGTLLLAEPSAWSGFGFLAYLASNVGWLIYSYSRALWPLFFQTIVFTAASLWGIWRWILQPQLGLA